jgi:hypothetical protein
VSSLARFLWALNGRAFGRARLQLRTDEWTAEDGQLPLETPAGGITSGVGSAAGTSTATAAGASTAEASASSTGTGAATGASSCG